MLTANTLDIGMEQLGGGKFRSRPIFLSLIPLSAPFSH